ncbi:unnamed protein product [Somion occarium]|uniref:FYVE-type domain-containing protein n=1 Tax=Somion occarium TaxID=3059160 RepID=A0ABP1DB08_9APHY
MEAPPYIPYQAYKSKRHSKTPSNQFLTPNVSPPQARPAVVLGNGHVFSEPVVPQHRDVNGDTEKVDSATDAPNRLTERPASVLDDLTRYEQISPLSITVTAVPAESRSVTDSPLSLSPPVVAKDTPSSTTSSIPPSPTTSERPQINGKAPESMNNSAASSSTSSPATSPRSNLTTRKVSTFRHIPLRPVNARPPQPPSPLRPPGTHTYTASNTSTSTRLLGTPEPRSRVSSTASTPNERVLSSMPSIDLHRHPAVIPPKAVSPIPSQSLTPASALSPSSSSTSLPILRQQQRSPAPYRPGFQPQGVRRPRTDDFLEARRASRDSGRIERTRLERRLEKLVNLHFPHPNKQKATELQTNGHPSQQTRRQSSLFDLTFEDLRNKTVSDLWKEAIQPSTSGKMDVRAAEQIITPWEEDAAVTLCPLCSASFHPLTNRKHHCRLCGRIICSLPVKYPQRQQPCSLLFVADPITGAIEEVKEGVDYGVRRRNPSISQGKGKGKELALTDEEKFLKGVRICRDCRPVLLRRQYLQEVHHVPIFSKLYDAFISLEKEIEEALPQFQELVLSLSNDERPSPEASAARKRLLEAFAQYDALAKRIRKIPSPEGQGSSQDRVQTAILSRANNFLQKNMFPLQALPKPKRLTSDQAPKADVEEHSQMVDPDSEVAHALQPLLEQEALLESFVEEAKAHRKFEDVKILKANLAEIRAEIDRILANAEDGVSARAKPKS